MRTTRSPFDIEGPALISFSGGRTSGFMLRQIMDRGLREDVFVTYANTGKERRETLDFIHEIETRWDVPIHWLERVPYPPGVVGELMEYSQKFREVTYETASREGEPFDALLRKYNYLPTPRMRLCTQELKIRVMKHFMFSQGIKDFTMVIGLREDEPRRLARMRDRNSKAQESYDEMAPLAEALQTLEDVTAFWKAQPFDLRLLPHEGNCDLCFLKSLWKKELIAAVHPELVEWWAAHEKQTGQTFRLDHPPYISLRSVEADRPACETDTDIEDCTCID